MIRFSHIPRPLLRSLLRSLPQVVLGTVLAGCTVTPIAPIPRPLPETLAWAAPEPTNTGAFLGLKTRENLSGGFDDLDFQAGLFVVRVVENSPAARAGVRNGDVLLSLDGKATDDVDTLSVLLDRRNAGDDVELEVQRGDTAFLVQVQLDAIGDERAGTARQPAEATALYRLDPSRSRAAWRTGRGGVVLVASEEEAPFPRAGVPVGSVLLSIDDEAVLSDLALVRALQEQESGASVRVDFMHPGGDRRTARVSLQAQPTRITRFSLPILTTYDADAEGTRTSFVLLDLWFLSLFRYERDGEERRWSFLRFFQFESGVGELTQ